MDLRCVRLCVPCHPSLVGRLLEIRQGWGPVCERSPLPTPPTPPRPAAVSVRAPLLDIAWERVTSWDRLLSLGIAFARCVHVVPCARASFLIISENTHPCGATPLFTHSSPLVRQTYVV